MSELAVPEQHNAPAVQQGGAVSPFRVESSIARWATEADMAWKLAENLARTSFVPATMRGKVGDIAGCLLAGQELGLGPMASLKSMDVIHGVVGMRAHAMRGLVQSRGHEIELIESSDTVCRMRGRRKGAEAWQEVVWTIGRAQQAGFVAKNPNYKSQPANMLIARATGEISRLIASDVLHGVPYTVEELRDTESRTSVVRVGARATAAEILGQQPAPAPQPSAEPEPVPQAADTTPEEPGDIWDELARAAKALGWDTDRAAAVYAQMHGGNEIGGASDEELREYHVWLIQQAQQVEQSRGAA